jgi:hypothetical protein
MLVKLMLIEIEHGDEVCFFASVGTSVAAKTGYVRDKANEITSRGCKNLLADLRALPSIGSALSSAFTFPSPSDLLDVSAGGANQRVRAVLDLICLNTVPPLVMDLPSGMSALGGQGPAERIAGKSKPNILDRPHQRVSKDRINHGRAGEKDMAFIATTLATW